MEFFPEEGKYHADGHSDCQVCLEPQETRRLGGICPLCSKPLTIGVQYRVKELADRALPYFPVSAPEVFSLIPLPEILGELLDCGPLTKGVMRHYAQALAIFGSEFELLLRTPVVEIEHHAPLLAEAIRRVRSGAVIRQPGYDGRFGIIRTFAPGELGSRKGSVALFSG